MKIFLITTLVSLAYAKPQYSYPTPSRQPSGIYGSPNVGIGAGTASGAGAYSGSSSFNTNLAERAAKVKAQASAGASQAGYSAGVAGGFGGGYSGGGYVSGGAGGGGTLVQKHIYVHVAPPEPEEFRPRQSLAAGQATKHYKIIFIKAPSYSSYQQQILQAQAQNEEKTLVYVLVKKPDDVADITLPTPAPTPPSKPEVYFIRYKAKSEVNGGGASGSATTAGSQLYGAPGAGASLNVASASSSSSQLNLNTVGPSVSAVSQPASVYGPPGKSGPY